MELAYRVVIALVLTMFKVMGWRITVAGAEHMPRRGPAVVATNHVGYLDFTFVGYAARGRRRLVRFLAKKEIFDHRLAGPLMRAMGHIPVDRFGRAAEAIATATAALRRGEVVGMFPEATISRSFVPRDAKSGAARMAMAAGAPLVPGAVWGSQRLLTKGRPPNFQRGVAVTVTFGEPVPYEPGDDPAEVTARLMAAITELVDKAAADYPQRPAGEDDRWWLPAHLGGTAPTVAEADALAARERAERREQRRRQRKR
ncbi:MAG TPA: lysophospholipid acyltransferase family protein [Egibacteraceae bacterium]|nr:lysophospholipid acyltransferase family protein [Egibacteraceae bacterium]